VARRITRLGPILLREEPLPNLPADEMEPAVIAALRHRGVGLLSWSESAVKTRERLRFARAVDGAAAWPDVSDVGLADSLEAWLAPAIAALLRLSAFGKIDLGAALLASLSYAQRRELDQIAPERVTVPSGSSIAIDYSGEVPVAAVKLQEMFGARIQPTVGRGRVPLLLHLLSPAGRPIQVTRDIGGFWTSSYQEVRKDLRGRYPKHPWPEDPLTAIPTRHVKARMGQP
jgi:ATP-dependent helicase HrpB